jgi:hypothetical protein
VRASKGEAGVRAGKGRREGGHGRACGQTWAGARAGRWAGARAGRCRCRRARARVGMRMGKGEGEQRRKQARVLTGIVYRGDTSLTSPSHL